MNIISFLLFRALPLLLMLYGLRSSAKEYTRYLRMAKDATFYATAYGNMSQFVPSLERHYARNREFPRDLEEYLRGEFSSRAGNPGRDPWGNLYELDEPGFEKFTLKCCGADKRCDTKDDLTMEGMKRAPKSHTLDLD